MPRERIHRFEHEGKRYAIDPETCFCFECDAVSWDVLNYYPEISANRIYHELGGQYPVKELSEVLGELEWLRATKSILPQRKLEDLHKAFELPRGLRKLTVAIPSETLAAETAPAGVKSERRSWFGGSRAASATPQQLHWDNAALGHAAALLLLARSEAQKELLLEFVASDSLENPDQLAGWMAAAFQAARLTGKKLTAAVRIEPITLSKTPDALEGHHLSIRLDIHDAGKALEALRILAKTQSATLDAWAKTIQPGIEGVSGRIILRPGNPDFGQAPAALDEAGFSHIELDLEGAWAANPLRDPSEFLPALDTAAKYYAQRLLKHHYFRLDPVASLFWRIYQGTPQPRSDDAGTNELAIDAQGAIYPSWRLKHVSDLCAGQLNSGVIDDAILKPFEDLGVPTTSSCMSCWARNLCGGGCSAVHYAYTRAIHKPHEPWCQAQRAWMAAAVSAFNLLSSAGVNFSRMYNALGKSSRPSLFTLAKAAFRMHIGVRPIEEADAKMLTEWENANPAAYFVFNETGVLLATRYDREMDSIYPRGIDRELLLLRRNGDPFGILKIRPDRVPGAALGWVYFHDTADYAAPEIRKSFKFILQEAAGQQAFRRLVIAATREEFALHAFLTNCGFAHEGAQRQAVYLHGQYHDADFFGIRLDL